MVKGGAIKVVVLKGAVIVGWGGGAPSLYLSPGGGEIGMGSIFSGGGEIGMGSIFSGGGEIGMGSIFSGGGEIGGVGLGRGVSLVDSGESLQVFEFTTEVSEGLRMIVGYGRIRVLVVVAVVVVTRGAAATGGAVLFGHLAANERGQERRRGVGLSSALQEQDFEHVGVPEDGNFESCLEAEGVVGLPMQGCGDGYTGFIGSEAYDVGPSVLIEIYRLPYPGVAIFGSEVYEPDAEVAFEFGGLVFGADSEFLEEGVHGFWDLGAG